MSSAVPSTTLSTSTMAGVVQAGQEGYVHTIERGGTVDGPGMRMVVFLAGCPLRCQYCHNPDARHLKGGTLRPVAWVLDEISKYKAFLKMNNGGVTISGGEPMVQLEFARSILAGCKAMGLHTALDTSGFLGDKADDAFLELVDLVLLDIKSGQENTYKRVTGVELEPTLAFAKRLEALGRKVWVRFVLVPGLTDSEPNIRALGNFVGELGNVERVEVLPFHKMGEAKWQALKDKYTLWNTTEPTKEQVAHAYTLLREQGVAPNLLG